MHIRARRRLAGCSRWTTRLALALLVLLAVWPLWLGIGIALGFFPVGGVDFKAYYLTGRRVLEGVPLYGTGLADTVPAPRSVRFLYPPVVALPFVLLPVAPPLVARVAFLLGQFGFLWASVLVLLRAWAVPLSRLEALAVGWLVLGFQPVGFLLRIGNVTGFVAGLLCLSVAVTLGPATRDRPLLGGVLATLAAFPKPYVAAAGAHLFGNWRRLLGAGLTGIALVLAGLALFGPATTRSYLEVLLAGNAWGAPRPPEPFGWHYRSFGWFVAERAVLQVVVLAVAVLTAVVARERDRAMAFAMGSVAVPLAAPSADTLTLLVALPGLLVAGLDESRRRGVPAVVIGGALCVQGSVYLVRLLDHYGPKHAPDLPWVLARRLVPVQPATVGLLAVFALCVVRVWTPHVQRLGFVDDETPATE